MSSPAPATGPGNLISYSFVTASLGWALDVATLPANSAGRYSVFRTLDGARHWQPQLTGHVGLDQGAPPSVQFLDNANGFVVVGYPIEVHRTIDGGLHWATVGFPPSIEVVLITFSDPRHGWFLGRPPPNVNQALHLYATSDSGDTWHQLPNPPPRTIRIVFRSPAEGWIWTDEQGPPHVYASSDGGESWQSHDLPELPGRLQGETVVVVGVRLLPLSGVVAYVAVRDSGGIRLPAGEFTSFDVGNSWRYVPPRPVKVRPSVESFEDATHWWTIDGGSLYKSPDAGQTWRLVTSNLENGAYWGYVPYVIDSMHAWARVEMGEGTGLATTSDGGLQWSRVAVPIIG
jgi:photosystem II stability/assembly factor-like uncharacterized protein